MSRICYRAGRSTRPLTSLARAAGAAVLGIGVATAMAVAPAVAESRASGCGERKLMVDHLKSTYGEQRMGGGLQSATGLVELYVSAEGTWTLLLTRPDGTSCPIAVGEAWRNDNPVPLGEKPA